MKRTVGQRGVLLRLFMVLLVCAGLVAMHQMAGGNHRMAMSGTAAVHAAPSAVDPAAMSVMIDTAAVVGQITGAVADPLGGAAPACAAVLLALLVLAARHLALAYRPRADTSVARSPHGSVPLGRGPPRLLLAKLCVLRT